jgi:hypothetical protein
MLPAFAATIPARVVAVAMTAMSKVCALRVASNLNAFTDGGNMFMCLDFFDLKKNSFFCSPLQLKSFFLFSLLF